MKKFTLTLLAMIFALFVVSCGDSKKDEPTDPTDPTTDEDQTEPTTDEDPTEPTNPITDEEPVEDPDEDEPNDDEPAGCSLDANLINSDAERYFGFKGVGKINNPNVSQPDWASLVKVALKGIEDKDLDYATSYSFFMPTTLTASDGSAIDSVAVEALGDPNMSTGRFTTIAFAALPIDYIEMLKELVEDPDYMEYYPEYAEKHIVPIAPVVQIVDIVYTAGDDPDYVKQCMLAVNKYGDNEVFGQETSIGKFQVCYENNETFGIGETFKLAMNAELSVGQEIVDLYDDVDSIDDLCTCFDLKATGDDDEVDCQTIPEFAGDVTVVCKESEHKQLNAAEDGCDCMTGYHADGDNCVEDVAPLTCNAEEHKELNEAGDACDCMTGYHADGDNCVEDVAPLTCNAEEHKELNAAGDACVCMTGYTENAETHVCEAE